MLIIGCDFHTRFQQIAMAEDSTGKPLRKRGLTLLFFSFVSHPQLPFTRPNNRSTLIFSYSLKNT